jgi:ATP-dependent DNA helicase RecG
VPRRAFREAVLNAIQHRDYSTGNPIHIHIYPGKVLIYNDGRLPENWTVEKLFTTHTSMPYNPLIAGTFFRSGQIEAWGRGIEKITDSCKAWGKSEPYYEVRSNYVMIGFNTDAGIVENVVDNIVENGGVNSVQTKILELMQAEPRITAKAIANEVGIAPRNVQVHVQTLKKMGLIERVGSDKGGYWAIKLPK